MTHPLHNLEAPIQRYYLNFSLQVAEPLQEIITKEIIISNLLVNFATSTEIKFMRKSMYYLDLNYVIGREIITNLDSKLKYVVLPGPFQVALIFSEIHEEILTKFAQNPQRFNSLL